MSKLIRPKCSTCMFQRECIRSLRGEGTKKEDDRYLSCVNEFTDEYVTDR